MAHLSAERREQCRDALIRIGAGNRRGRHFVIHVIVLHGYRGTGRIGDGLQSCRTRRDVRGTKKVSRAAGEYLRRKREIVVFGTRVSHQLDATTENGRRERIVLSEKNGRL